MQPQDLSQPAPQPQQRSKRTWLPLVAVVAGVLVVILAIIYFLNPGGLFSALKPVQEPAVVTVSSTGFSPETIRIKKGQSVEWTNTDSMPHQIAADPFPDHSSLPNLYAADPLSTDDSFSYTFNDAGTYTYHDQLHPAEFKGTVIVE